MSRVAIMFPGQDVLPGPAALEIAGRWPAAAALLEVASEAAAVDVRRLCRFGDPGLQRTEVLQPVLVAASLGVALALSAAGVCFDLACGHSLGELTALSAAGAFHAADAVRFAAARGRAMARAAASRPGGMVALHASAGEVRAAIHRGRRHGLLDLAARNGPHDWVLSGDRAALRAVEGCHRVTPLAVAGPWHSRAMAPAAAAVHEAAAALAPTRPRARVVATTRPIVVDDVACIPLLLTEQLTRPVRFTSAVALLQASAVGDLVLVGSCRALRAMVRSSWTGSLPRVHIVERPADVERAAAILGAAA